MRFASAAGREGRGRVLFDIVKGIEPLVAAAGRVRLTAPYPPVRNSHLIS